VKSDIIISVLSTGIAAIAVIVSIIGLRSSRDTARRQEALTEVREWRHELGIWASEALGVLSEAIYACEAIPDNASPRDYFGPHARRLRPLINRGRFLLPNQQPDQQPEYRGTLPAAFLGYRHAALEPLVAAVQVMEENGLENRLKNDVARYRPFVLRELEREFVSNISLILARDLDNVKIANEEIVERQQARALRQNETSFLSGDKLLLSNVVSRVVEGLRGR